MDENKFIYIPQMLATRIKLPSLAARHPTHRRFVCPQASPKDTKPSHEDLLVAIAYRDVQASCFDDLDEAACAVAWDNVDEVYRGLAHRREKQETDPLEVYCSALPDGDECREYDV